MFRNKIIVFIFLLLLFVFTCLNAQSNSQILSFPLPDHGILKLSVPKKWKHFVKQPPQSLPPTIILMPNSGDEFKVLITPLWSTGHDPDYNKPQRIRSLINGELSHMLPGAVEKQVKINEVKGVYGSGYYFLLTDKAPKPGEYLYVIRAGIGVGNLLLSVTILSRDKKSEGITETNCG